MIRFLVLFLLNLLWATPVKAEEQRIEEPYELQCEAIKRISEVLESEKDLGELGRLDLHNKRGILYFFLGEFDLALKDFNVILRTLYESKKINETLFGAALWGRLLCHAYQSQEYETYEDIEVIYAYFVSNDLDHLYDYKIISTAKFANPNERLTPAECKERVRGTANLMRLLTAKIPNGMIAAAVNYIISELENTANGCCDRNHWTDCLTPVIDAWHYMKNCMDKGVALAPKLLLPIR